MAQFAVRRLPTFALASALAVNCDRGLCRKLGMDNDSVGNSADAGWVEER